MSDEEGGEAVSRPVPAAGAPESTVGTGSVVAGGCTAATLREILVAVVVLLLVRLL